MSEFSQFTRQQRWNIYLLYVLMVVITGAFLRALWFVMDNTTQLRGVTPEEFHLAVFLGTASNALILYSGWWWLIFKIGALTVHLRGSYARMNAYRAEAE